MENTPKNVRYLQLSGVTLSLMSLVILNLAYCHLSQISPTLFALSLPGLCMIALSLFAFINALYTFKFSADIHEDSFAKWLVVQYRFWIGVSITVSLLVLAFLLDILVLVFLFRR